MNTMSFIIRSCIDSPDNLRWPFFMGPASEKSSLHISSLKAATSPVVVGPAAQLLDSESFSTA